MVQFRQVPILLGTARVTADTHLFELGTMLGMQGLSIGLKVASLIITT